MTLSVTLADARTKPFPYAIFSSIFPDTTAAALLSWLQGTDCWQLARTDFYEQYEFCIDDIWLPEPIRFLQDLGFRNSLKTQMESLFSTTLLPDITAFAHKLTPTQHIGIHNDLLNGGESYRLTVQINEAGRTFEGGLFMLFNSQDVEDVHRILKPIHNSAVAFAISERSYHAVTKQHVGERYTIVFSFQQLVASN